MVALWREALLARAVLRGLTRGYRHHPQLDRFREHAAPRSAISAYLAAVLSEANARGYDFDARKVGPVRSLDRIPVTRGQIRVEWDHLMHKLAARSPVHHERWRSVRKPECHPLLRPIPGAVEPWERLDP